MKMRHATGHTIACILKIIPKIPNEMSTPKSYFACIHTFMKISMAPVVEPVL